MSESTSLANITVVPAQPEHATGILVVQHDCWIATYPNEAAGITRSVVEERVSNYQSPERIAKWRGIIAGSEHVTVALDGDQVVGFSCAKRAATVNHLTAIYVLPEYHGRGVAQRLMDAAMAWLGDKKDILVEVVSYNGRAIRFYEKYGFVLTGETGDHDLLPTVMLRRPGGPR